MGRVPKSCFSKRSGGDWLRFEPVRATPCRLKWGQSPSCERRTIDTPGGRAARNGFKTAYVGSGREQTLGGRAAFNPFGIASSAIPGDNVPGGRVARNGFKTAYVGSGREQTLGGRAAFNPFGIVSSAISGGQRPRRPICAEWGGKPAPDHSGTPFFGGRLPKSSVRIVFGEPSQNLRASNLCSARSNLSACSNAFKPVGVIF